MLKENQSKKYWLSLAFIEIIFYNYNTPDDDNSWSIVTGFFTATQSTVNYGSLLKNFCSLIIENQTTINTEKHR